MLPTWIFLFSRLPYYNSRCVIGSFWSHSNFKRLNFRLYTNDVKSPFGILRAYCRKRQIKTKSGIALARSPNSQQQVDKQGSKSSFGYRQYSGRGHHRANTLVGGRHQCCSAPLWQMLARAKSDRSFKQLRSAKIQSFNDGGLPPARTAVAPMMTRRPPLASHPDSPIRRAEHLIIIKTDLQEQRHIG